MIINEKQFGMICKQRGFQRLTTRYYARCYGEGLYQIIYTGIKRHSSELAIVENPALKQRKHYCIKIIIRSLYGDFDESCFRPEPEAGGFSPLSLIGNLDKPDYFRDILYEYDIMEKYGFDKLDEINTHQKLVELELVKKGPDGDLRKLAAPLPDTYLMVGNYYEAQSYISHLIAHNAQSIVLTYGRYREDGENYIGTPCIQRWIKVMEKHIFLLNALREQQYDTIYQYLWENYSRNMRVVQKYGAQIHPSFSVAEVPEKPLD